MKLSVLYFARLRDAIGRSGEDIEVPAEVTTVGELRAWLVQRGAPWSAAFAEVRPVRVAMDQVLMLLVSACILHERFHLAA